MSQLDFEGVMETSISNDTLTLTQWLRVHGLQSMVSDLQQSGLTLKALLNSSEDDIREICQELNISAIKRMNLITKLKETPGSGATKQQEIVFVAIGDKEKEILDRSFRKTEIIGTDIKSIQTAIIGMYFVYILISVLRNIRERSLSEC